MQNALPRWDVTKLDRRTRIPQLRSDKLDLRSTSLESPRDKAKPEETPSLRESATSRDFQMKSSADANPLVGMIVATVCIIGMFFLAHWLAQTISFSASNTDARAILYALSGR
jgi:hypothetical protein